MTLILSGTDGLSDVDGSAATPAIRGTDTNTGIFFPAADQVAITTGGTQRAVVDASGNVGIGVTSPQSTLQVGNVTSGTSESTNKGLVMIQSSPATVDSAGGLEFKTSASGSGYGWKIGGLNTTNDPFVIGNRSNSAAFTERARIDSAGNMGLGVTPSAWASRTVLEVGAAGNAFVSGGAGDVYVTEGCYYNAGWKYGNSLYATALYNQYRGTHSWSTAASGTAGNTISFTQAMTLDASGLLAIGTTSPASATRLTLDYPGFVQMLMRSSGTDRISLYGDASVSAVDGKANPLAFYAGSAERARIDSSGQLLIGTTTSNSNYGLRISGNRGIDLVGWGNARGEAINLKAHNTSNADAIYFNTSAAQVGVISITSTATSYVTSSDYRLKENIAPMTGALATVSALKPCTYTWKSDGSDGQGFIAHELAEVCPQAVSGKKDAVNEEGSIKPQGVDTSFLVATLTAAIQELKAIVDAQAVEIAALKGTA